VPEECAAHAAELVRDVAEFLRRLDLLPPNTSHDTALLVRGAWQGDSAAACTRLALHLHSLGPEHIFAPMLLSLVHGLELAPAAFRRHPLHDLLHVYGLRQRRVHIRTHEWPGMSMPYYVIHDVPSEVSEVSEPLEEVWVTEPPCLRVRWTGPSTASVQVTGHALVVVDGVVVCAAHSDALDIRLEGGGWTLDGWWLAVPGMH
jgi:hypothetical protein